MHIRTKFDGGKVINRSQSGAWENRSMGAGLRQNLGAGWGPQVWKKSQTPLPTKCLSVAAQSAEMVKKDKERKSTKAVKAKRRMSKYVPTDGTTTAARSAYS